MNTVLPQFLIFFTTFWAVPNLSPEMEVRAQGFPSPKISQTVVRITIVSLLWLDLTKTNPAKSTLKMLPVLS